MKVISKPWVHFGWEARRMRVLWLIKWENREKTKQPKVLQLFQQVSECLWLTACLLSLMSLKKEGTRQLALVLNQNNIVCCLPHFEKKKKLFAIASFKNHNMFFLRCKKEKHSCWRSSVKKDLIYLHNDVSHSHSNKHSDNKRGKLTIFIMHPWGTQDRSFT